MTKTIRNYFLFISLFLNGCGFYPESNYYTENQGDALKFELRDREFGSWKLNSSLLNYQDVYVRVRHLEIDNAGSRLSIKVENDNPSKYKIRPESFSIEVADTDGRIIYGKRSLAAYFGETSHAPENVHREYFNTHAEKQHWWFSIRYPRNTPVNLIEKINMDIEIDGRPLIVEYKFPVVKKTKYKFSWFLYGGGV